MRMQNESKQPNSCPIVIVVDDDSGVRNSLKFSLKVEGFAVRAYESADDLLDSSDTLECACFVIDQKLPGMTGLDLIATLRERRISTPAILIISDPSVAVIDRAKRANIRIVEKPFLNPALVDGIRAACSQHSVSPH
jgi:FixJ family two-component response regulator